MFCHWQKFLLPFPKARTNKLVRPCFRSVCACLSFTPSQLYWTCRAAICWDLGCRSNSIILVILWWLLRSYWAERFFNLVWLTNGTWEVWISIKSNSWTVELLNKIQVHNILMKFAWVFFTNELVQKVLKTVILRFTRNILKSLWKGRKFS